MFGYLPVNYPSVVIDGPHYFIMEKAGSVGGAGVWGHERWAVKHVVRVGRDLRTLWTRDTDWHPVPRAGASGGPIFEPPFQCVLARGYVWIPASGGALLKVEPSSGAVVNRVSPFGEVPDDSIYLVGTPTVSASGDIYYCVVQLATVEPWDRDVLGSWLVRVDSEDHAQLSAISGATWAPRGDDLCTDTFSRSDLPLPPSPDARAPGRPCTAGGCKSVTRGCRRRYGLYRDESASQ